MFGGRGGLDPSKMKQMMEQMGIDIQDIDAEEVVIRTAEEELVFTDAEVQRMDAQGQQTYQVVGEPESREPGAGATVADDAPDEEEAADSSDEEEEAAADASAEATGEIPQADVEIVAQRTGASEAHAREALEEADGDLAAAVSRLE